MKIPSFEAQALFKVFRDYDVDSVGFLEPHEYVNCLSNFPDHGLQLNLIRTLTLIADCDKNGRIDYSEMMKLFTTMVYYIRFQHDLQQVYDEDKQLRDFDNKTAIGQVKSPPVSV